MDYELCKHGDYSISIRDGGNSYLWIVKGKDGDVGTVVFMSAFNYNLRQAIEFFEEEDERNKILNNGTE